MINEDQKNLKLKDDLEVKDLISYLMTIEKEGERLRRERES